MNPLFLLLGFFGANAFVNAFGSDDDDSVGTVSAAPSDDTSDDGGGSSTSAEAPSGNGVSGSGQPLNDGPTGSSTNTPIREDSSTPDFTPVNIPVAEAQSGPDSDGASTDALTANGSVTVMAGRVATLEPPADDIVGLEITSDVNHGNLTINPDGTLSLVMTQSDFTGNQSFSYDAQHADGSTTSHTVNLEVKAGLQDDGWGTGELHYMLATDENDKVIVEHGEEHTKVYVSGSNSAYSVKDIANAEGMNVNQVTGEWLANHGGYGQSEGMALNEDAAMLLWNEVTPLHSETSNWLLFERGYEYEDLGRVVPRGASGEDELNPLFIGAWGDGDRPVMKDHITISDPDYHDNIVFQDIYFADGVMVTRTDNIIFDNISVTGDEMVALKGAGVTVRNSEFFDIHNKPEDGDELHAHHDRIQALYAGKIEGMLVEGNTMDLNGWAPGVQEASMFSHNLYFSADMEDVTLRDNIFMRGSSYGAQVRSGGFIEDNVFIDNNAAFSTLGGDYNNAGQTGTYTLMSDNLVTSGGHVDGSITGALTLGIKDEGELTSFVDNIVTHLADPANAAEQQEKDWAHSPLKAQTPYYNDTIIYNWTGSNEKHGDQHDDVNTDGLNTNILDQTTIQQFTAQLLGKSNATIEDLGDYLRERANGELDDMVDADLIIRFFQEGFGVAADIRDDAATLRFVPDDLSDGVRWDNRLNWDTEDLPGFHAADNVELGGNHVTFGTDAEINWLDMGDGGALNVYGGRLDLNGGITGNDSATLHIEGAGQVWADGSDASNLEINLSGGRFANEGVVEGADLTAMDGQAILATGGARFELGDGDTLSVAGSAKAGFDGDGGRAILDLQEGSTLALVADEDGLGSIQEFRSGAFDDDPNVQSGIDLGDATLSIDLAGLSAADGTQFTLMSADEIAGIFDDASVTGLGGRSAKIIIDYEADTVTLELSSGNGSVDVETVGSETDVSNGYQALWDELTADHGLVSDTAQARLPGNEEEDMIEDALIDTAA